MKNIQNVHKNKSKWIKVEDKLPDVDKIVDVKCENGRAWGYFTKDFGLSGWMINITRIFCKGKDPNIGKVLKWRYINDCLPSRT